MKKNIFIGLVLLLIAGLFPACEKEYFKPSNDIPTGPMSFSKDIVPILSGKCSISGCHQGSVPPNLSETKAYLNLVDGGLVDTLSPLTSILYLKITSNMPPTGKLPSGNINRILLWIQQGALEN